MIRASLVSSALSTFWDFNSSEEQRDFYNHLADYSAALKGGDLGLVSIVFWTISRLQRVPNPWLFSPKAFESLVKAYPGDVQITLENFDSAHTTVLDPDNWDQVDRYGIMTIMLRCAEHLIAAGRGHESIERIELKERFRVLGFCEVALRTGAIPQDENLQIMRRIRLETLTEIKNLLSDPEQQPEHIPSRFLDAVATYFQALVCADKSTSHLLQDGWLDIFDTFVPLIGQL
ncbi:hypothetical protein FS837_008336 [Tulasnella sp. UAMH 9824]|nr:hypothetical protein FS837_008336 [Tulasnella sp. UAMH 9824]